MDIQNESDMPASAIAKLVINSNENGHAMIIPCDAMYRLAVALEKAEAQLAERDNDCWTYESTVKKLLERAGSAESACAEAARILKSGERMALPRAVNILLAVGEDADPYKYPVVLPASHRSLHGREMLLKTDVVAALMSAGVPVEGK